MAPRLETVKHNLEPRNVGFSKEVADLYQDRDHGWLKKGSANIFAGLYQKDLFIFAMALGKNRERISDFGPKEKQDNVSVDAMTPAQKWALLSIGIAESDGLLCLKNEGEIYSAAERYAREGIQILRSHMEEAGPNYPKKLEVELRELLGLLED
ncbi:hypothetical protein DSECCO2_428300 [anaerobic digester metagenome]